MKTVKKISIVLAAFLVCYLLGAFYEVSFDASKWAAHTREGVIIFCILLSCVLLLFDL